MIARIAGSGGQVGDHGAVNRAVARARTAASLLRWLGPWTPESRAPAIRVERVLVDGPRPFPAKLFVPPGRASGAYAIAPGVHFLGPDDTRMDRFCRVLAASGLLTLAPYLPDYVALRVGPAAIDDFARAFDALRDHPACPVARPGVFSISFGSLPALRLAAARSGDLGGVVVFGGYADWDATIRFAASGELDGRAWVRRDLRNLPVVFMNLLDDLDDEHRPGDPAPLVAAWRRYVEATWGDNAMKEAARWQPIARALAAEVPPATRELYLRGCGLLPGAGDLIGRALARRADLGYLDVRPHLATVRCPVWLVHGLTDDVIPWPQAEALARALPASASPRVLLTGLYGHTQIEGARGPVAAAREVATMARIVAAMVAAGTEGARASRGAGGA
jgi:pimeloyl-ACP methyl ester carboxylesterase